MNQTCKVCGEPAAGFHFGAFTCEGCKSFFGRSYNNLSSISECKNSGKCIIDKKNRTTCKACRLRKCYTVGMSKGGSRYGRRSNWFKIHCLLQEQQQQAEAAVAAAGGSAGGASTAAAFGDMAAAAAAAVAAAGHQQRSPHLSGFLGGYNGYLPPEMGGGGGGAAAYLTASPSSAGRHPADSSAAAAAALPFFSMMNALPTIGSPQSAFQLPPHLLFPGYHHAAAAAAAHHHHHHHHQQQQQQHHHQAAAAAADVAYRNELFKHRQSVDSIGSAESHPHEFSSPSGRRPKSTQNTEEDDEENADGRRMPSPELCVSGDEDLTMPHSVPPATTITSPHHYLNYQNQNQHFQQQQQHHQQHHHLHHHHHHHDQQHIHSPVAMRPTAPQEISSPVPGSQPLTPEPTPPSAAVVPKIFTTEHSPSHTTLTGSFSAKMQSLSPVSVCSISGETTMPNMPKQNVVPAHQEDGPMDLSMKTHSSTQSEHSSVSPSATATASAAASVCEEDHDIKDIKTHNHIDARRKFYEMNNEDHDSEDNSSEDDCAEGHAHKRQKLGSGGNESPPASSTQQGFASGYGNAATSLRGIFVCV